MSSWFERGRPAILQSLAPVFDQIDAELRAELEERDKNKHAALVGEVDRLRARLAALEELELENKSLKGDIARLASVEEPSPRPLEHISSAGLRETKTALLPPAPRSRKPLEEISNNTVPTAPLETAKSSNPSSEVNWELEYKRLWARHNKYAERLEETKAKAKIFREAHEKWEKYALALEKKLNELKNTAAIPGNAAAWEATKTPGAQERSTPPEAVQPVSLEAEGQAGQRSGDVSFLSAPNVDEPVGKLDSATETRSQFRRAASTPRSGIQTHDATSYSTESMSGNTGEEAQKDLVLPSLLQDGALATYTLVKQEPLSDEPVVLSERCIRKRRYEHYKTEQQEQRIKNESSENSSPIVTSTSVFFSPQESMDLDAGPVIQTPRRPRHRNQLRPSATESLQAPNYERGDSQTIPASPNVRGKVECVGGHGHQRAASPVQNHEATLTSTGRPSIFEHEKLDRAVMSLAEDGQHPVDHGTDSAWLGGGRLNALLNETPSTHSKDPVLVRPVKSGRQTPQSSHLCSLELSVPRRELPFGKTNARNDQSTPKAAPKGLLTPLTGVRRTTPKSSLGPRETFSINKAKGRLRKLPLARLNLADFKVNPAFNEGRNYAFSEVVRGKAGRADLPGCIDEKCCGKKFREMALNERDAVGPSLLQIAANVKLLEEHLGSDARRLESMSRQEKEELWVDAKVRDYANRFGRHKHRYARPPSPAALWNVDMPSTQEFAKEKEEMQKEVRKQVEQRYRDAMRGGGRWLFRDE